MSLFRQAAKRLTMALLPRERIVARGSGPGVALTFDDGPHPEHTPRLLDALAATGIPATFFVVGERAAAHPALLRRILSEGHEVGNHTWTHSEPHRTSARQLMDEVRRTRDLIEDIAGQSCVLFRPPKGELTLRKLAALCRERQTIVLWNQDTRDYRMNDGPDGALQMTAWWRRYQRRSGDIILMHDNHPHAAVAVDCLATQEPDITTVCRPLSEVLSSDNGRLTATQPSRGIPCTG